MVPDIHATFHNQPLIMRRVIWRHVFGHRLTHTQLNQNVLKCNWVTGSPPQLDTLLASWYPNTCKVSKSAIQHVPSNMAPCLRTHRLTHTQLNHQRLVSILSAIPVLGLCLGWYGHLIVLYSITYILTDVHRCMSAILTNIVSFTLFYGHGLHSRDAIRVLLLRDHVHTAAVWNTVAVNL